MFETRFKVVCHNFQRKFYQLFYIPTIILSKQNHMFKKIIPEIIWKLNCNYSLFPTGK